MLFLKGLELYGKSWKKISQIVKTRTVVQIRTHAQKYLIKSDKAKKLGFGGTVMMDGKAVCPVPASGSASKVRASLNGGTSVPCPRSTLQSESHPLLWTERLISRAQRKDDEDLLSAPQPTSTYTNFKVPPAQLAVWRNQPSMTTVGCLLMPLPHTPCPLLSLTRVRFGSVWNSRQWPPGPGPRKSHQPPP